MLFKKPTKENIMSPICLSGPCMLKCPLQNKMAVYGKMSLTKQNAPKFYNVSLHNRMYRMPKCDINNIMSPLCLNVNTHFSFSIKEKMK